MQLIQYEATTKQVLKTPLLIVPPWINKFYILDLTPEKSFIKWCVDQGITVFVLSWVNPDARLAQKSFEEYMREGVIAALESVATVDRREAGPCHRLLRRRHAAFDHPRLSRRQKTESREVGDACSRPRSISPMPAT